MQAENLYTPDCIRTYSGKYMNVLEPTIDMICIEDIAHALSHLCRFGGHLPQFYSVAQHSYHCYQLIDGKYKREALFHDAAEAYLLDIPSPIKKHLTNYSDLEDKLMRLIAEKFCFEYPLPVEVKKIDRDMLETEWDILMLRKKTNEIECYPAAVAKKYFINAFNELQLK